MPTLYNLIASAETKEKDPKPKPSLDKREIVERKLLKGFWDTEVPIDKKKVSELARNAAKAAGVPAEYFYASAYEEGLRNIQYAGYTNDEDGVSEEYPIDGFMHYGLDTFGDKADTLKKKGYIPADLDYQNSRMVNEHGQGTNSARFRNNQDAMIAKAAYMREFQDNVKDYAKKKGVNLEGDNLMYFTMSAYNGGLGSAMKMINEAKGRDINKYVSEGQTSLKQIHGHIAPRMRYAKIMRDVIKEEDDRRAILVSPPEQPPYPTQLPIINSSLDVINRGY